MEGHFPDLNSEPTPPSPPTIKSTSIHRALFPPHPYRSKWCLERKKTRKKSTLPQIPPPRVKRNLHHEDLGGPWDVLSVHFPPRSLSRPMQLKTTGGANKHLYIRHRADRWNKRLTGLKSSLPPPTSRTRGLFSSQSRLGKSEKIN